LKVSKKLNASNKGVLRPFLGVFLMYLVTETSQYGFR